jgi:hypothetical protein
MLSRLLGRIGLFSTLKRYLRGWKVSARGFRQRILELRILLLYFSGDRIYSEVRKVSDIRARYWHGMRH